jgi:hypothetical protein
MVEIAVKLSYRSSADLSGERLDATTMATAVPANMPPTKKPKMNPMINCKRELPRLPRLTCRRGRVRRDALANRPSLELYFLPCQRRDADSQAQRLV